MKNFTQSLSNVSVNLIRPNTLNKNTLDEISNELELSSFSYVDALFSKTIILDKKELDISVWGITTNKRFYFLAGGYLNNSTDEFENPFQNSDDFYQFQLELKEQLGITNAEPYISDGGYYKFNKEIDSKEFSFFVYKS